MTLKNLLGQNAFWMVNKNIAKAVGIEAALLLSLLIDMDDTHGDWFFCTAERIEDETGLKRRSQTTAINKLVEVGFIEKTLQGTPAKMHFRMCTNKIVQNVQTRMYETYKQDCTKRTNILIEKTKELKTKEKKARARFAKPELLECESFFLEQGSTNFEAQKFHDFYESKNWHVGKSKMKDWKAAARNWVRRNEERNTKGRNQTGNGGFTPEGIQRIVNGGS